MRNNKKERFISSLFANPNLFRRLFFSFFVFRFFRKFFVRKTIIEKSSNMQGMKMRKFQVVWNFLFYVIFVLYITQFYTTTQQCCFSKREKNILNTSKPFEINPTHSKTFYNILRGNTFKTLLYLLHNFFRTKKNLLHHNSILLFSSIIF